MKERKGTALMFQDSLESEACDRSCDYLQKIFTEKPGACPKISNQSNYVSLADLGSFKRMQLMRKFQECTALCHLDGDCAETGKCCTYGCSRECALPQGRDPRLLPIPSSISVQERKRKR